MKLGKIWMAGFLVVAVAAAALAAVACSSAEPTEPAVSTEDIAAAVRSAVQDSAVSEEAIAGMMSDQIAEQVAMMAAQNPGMTAEEVNAMIAAAVASSNAMLADQLAGMDEGMSAEDMAAMMEDAVNKAVEDAVAMAVPQEADAPDRATGGQKFGGAVKVGGADFGNFDPDLMGLSHGTRYYFHRGFDGIIERGNSDELVNRLAESWEASEDLSEYTIKVRSGVKFHDGEDLTSEDIKYTIERMLDPESSSPVKSTLKYVENISTPDASTVVFSLAGANTEFPRDLTDYHVRVLPAHVDFSRITSGEVSGSGPFRKVGHSAAERTVYERNPSWWDGDKPYIDELVIFYMPEITTRLEALRSGAVDVLGVGDYSQIEALDADPNILLKQTPTAAIRNFVMDNREGSVFSDKNLRKAIQYGYDRELVRNASLYGLGFTGNDHPIGLNDQYYWKDQPLVAQDLAKAKGYLEAAGYADGIDVTLHTMNEGGMLNMSLALKESVAPLGINVEVVHNPTGTYWEEVWLVEPFAVASWFGRPASQALSLALRSTSDWNESHWVNPRFDELLDLAFSELDFQKRVDYYREIQEILIDNVPASYAMYTPAIIAHRSRVYGVEANPGPYQFVRDWWIDE